MDSVSTAQLAYGASILSFLGGVRWGTLVMPGSSIKYDFLAKKSYVWTKSSIKYNFLQKN
jgi:hypothetical protein